jgi:hypothetical protein
MNHDLKFKPFTAIATCYQNSINHIITPQESLENNLIRIYRFLTL